MQIIATPLFHWPGDDSEKEVKRKSQLWDSSWSYAIPNELDGAGLDIFLCC